jgi:hypothetical protein
MDLSTIYKNFKPFEPYFKLIFEFYYNEEGNPRVIDYAKPYMTSEDHKIFKENIISLHKKYLQLDVLSMEIFRLHNENIKLFFKNY